MSASPSLTPGGGTAPQYNQPHLHVAAADDIVYYSTNKIYLNEFSFMPLLQYVNTNEIHADNQLHTFHYKSDDIALVDGCTFPFHPFIAVIGDGTKESAGRRTVRVYDYFSGNHILRYRYSKNPIAVCSVGNLLITILANKLLVQPLPLGPSPSSPNPGGFQAQNYGLTTTIDPNQAPMPQFVPQYHPQHPAYNPQNHAGTQPKELAVPTANNLNGVYALYDAAAHTHLSQQISQLAADVPIHIKHLLDQYTFCSNIPTSAVTHSFLCFPDNPPASASADPLLQGYQGFVGIIDLVTSHLTRTIPVCRGPIQRLRVSPDGHLLAVASDKGTLIRVFNTTTGNLLHTFRRGRQAAQICAMAFSFGNELLAVASKSSKIVHIFKLTSATFNDDNINVIENGSCHGSDDEIWPETMESELESQAVRFDPNGIEPAPVPNTQVPPVKAEAPAPAPPPAQDSWTNLFSWNNLSAATSSATSLASSLMSASTQALTQVAGLVELPRHYGYAVVSHPDAFSSTANHSPQISPQLPPSQAPPHQQQQQQQSVGASTMAYLGGAFNTGMSTIGSMINPNQNSSSVSIADLRIYCIYSHARNDQQQAHSRGRGVPAMDAQLTVCGYFLVAFCTNGTSYIYRGGKGAMKLIKEETLFQQEFLAPPAPPRSGSPSPGLTGRDSPSLGPSASPLLIPGAASTSHQQQFPARNSLTNHTPSNHIAMPNGPRFPSSRNQAVGVDGLSLHDTSATGSPPEVDMSTPFTKGLSGPGSGSNPSSFTLSGKPVFPMGSNENEILQRKIQNLSAGGSNSTNSGNLSPALLIGSQSPPTILSSNNGGSFQPLSLGAQHQQNHHHQPQQQFQQQQQQHQIAPSALSPVQSVVSSSSSSGSQPGTVLGLLQSGSTWNNRRAPSGPQITAQAPSPSVSQPQPRSDLYEHPPVEAQLDHLFMSNVLNFTSSSSNLSTQLPNPTCEINSSDPTMGPGPAGEDEEEVEEFPSVITPLNPHHPSANTSSEKGPLNPDSTTAAAAAPDDHDELSAQAAVETALSAPADSNISSNTDTSRSAPSDQFTSISSAGTVANSTSSLPAPSSAVNRYPPPQLATASTPANSTAPGPHQHNLPNNDSDNLGSHNGTEANQSMHLGHFLTTSESGGASCPAGGLNIVEALSAHGDTTTNPVNPSNRSHVSLNNADTSSAAAVSQQQLHHGSETSQTSPKKLISQSQQHSPLLSSKSSSHPDQPTLESSSSTFHSINGDEQPHTSTPTPPSPPTILHQRSTSYQNTSQHPSPTKPTSTSITDLPTVPTGGVSDDKEIVVKSVDISDAMSKSSSSSAKSTNSSKKKKKGRR